MADKIQILIEAILKKTTKQELENELRKIEKNLKPLKVNTDTNAEAQIKLHKSLQKIYKEEEKQRLNQEKLAQRALAEKEKSLQYEQKVRMAIEKQKKKEEELNKILQERIVIYKQEAETKLLNLKSKHGDLLNNADIKKQIGAFRESLNNLNTSNFNARKLNADFKMIEASVKNANAAVKTNAEAQIKLHKSLQKIYKEEEKQRLNQEKLAQRALAEKEKSLQYEQKVRMAIEKQKKKEEELNKILQERIVIYKQEAETKLLNLKSKHGDLLNNADIKKQIGAFRESLNNLNTSNFNARKLNADFKMIEASVKNANAAVKATNRDVMTLGDMFKVAWNKMLIWTGAGTLLFGTIRQIKAAVSYVSELDNALNEIRIVTNKTQEEVNQLGLSYNKLAKEMSVTTREIASTAADLFRQGLNDSQVEERMKAIIQYAKISSISLEESNKIITATANATGESVQKIIDVFAYLGRFCPAA